MPETKRPLKVFLCHAHSDKDEVKALYERLVKDGVDAWLDKEKLLPGQDWELEIRKAVRESDGIVVCLSKQFNSAGFRQKEVRLALDTAMEKPEGEIFIIPTRLEVCEGPESLKKWHRVDLFEDNGYDILIRALRVRAESIGARLQAKRSRMPRNSPYVKSEKPINEDRSAVSSSNGAKEADIDRKATSPRTPARATRKPFKIKTENIVALIGALATIIAAIINSPLMRWSTQTATPTVSVSTQVLASPTGSLAATLPTETLSPAQPSPSPGINLQPGTKIQHRALAGESLVQIAHCYGADYETVRNANPQINDLTILETGDRIDVPNIGSAGEIYGPPCVIYYSVQRDDTWQSIASTFNADVNVLMEANQGGTYSAGRLIVIPLGKKSAVPDPVTLAIPATPSSSSTLIKVDADVQPNRNNCYYLPIPAGQAIYFTTTVSNHPTTLVVHNPNEPIFNDAGSMILYGSLSSRSSDYSYCIFNRSASAISYRLEVGLSP